MTYLRLLGRQCMGVATYTPYVCNHSLGERGQEYSHSILMKNICAVRQASPLPPMSLP